jgi:hypothetical protein
MVRQRLAVRAGKVDRPVTWNRAPVAAALVAMLGPATGGLKVHPYPPEIINGPCVVVSRPQPVLCSAVAPTVDEVTLPVIVASGVEQEAALETVLTQCRSAIQNDSTLQGSVQVAWPAEIRNWRNITGAGGTQLLLAELILTIRM